MSVNPKKDIIIAELVADMDFGVTREQALASTHKKWQTTTRTFDRYWQLAKQIYSDEIEALRAARLDVKIAAEVEKVNSEIMDKNERMRVLTQMANGTLQVQRNVVTKDGVLTVLALPDYADRKAAIAELNKMDGEYAPVRKDITSGGEKLPPVNFQIILDDEKT